MNKLIWRQSSDAKLTDHWRALKFSLKVSLKGRIDNLFPFGAQRVQLVADFRPPLVDLHQLVGKLVLFFEVLLEQLELELVLDVDHVSGVGGGSDRRDHRRRGRCQGGVRRSFECFKIMCILWIWRAKFSIPFLMEKKRNLQFDQTIFGVPCLRKTITKPLALANASLH